MRRVRRRHHHGAYIVLAQSVNRDTKRQRRIDAAGKTDDCARETILAQIVAHTQRQRFVDLSLNLTRTSFCARREIPRAILDNLERLFEGDKLMRQLAVRIQRKRRAVEHQFVLSADKVDVERRNSGGRNAISQHFITLTLFVHVKGRGIEHQQHIGACITRGFCGAALPYVGADIDAAMHSIDLNNAWRAVTVEIAFFIEHFVIRQALFAIGIFDAAIAQQRSAVVTAIVSLFRVAHDDWNRRAYRQPQQLAITGAIKIRAQQQVFRRITAQRQLRRHQYVGPFLLRLLCRSKNPICIGRDGADGTVDLGDGNPER